MGQECDFLITPRAMGNLKKNEEFQDLKKVIP
jgi:hypothetical protein